jgi:hypothetical protein
LPERQPRGLDQPPEHEPGIGTNALLAAHRSDGPRTPIEARRMQDQAIEACGTRFSPTRGARR